MVAVNSLYQSRLNLLQQQQLLRSGNINESNISIFENTEGLTQGMLDGSCTDGKDDGKLGFGESVKSLAKGAIKSIIPSSPMGWVKAIAAGVGCAALIAVTGGAATPFLIAGGAALGAVQTGKGIYQASQATTDAEKKQALENIGGGVTTIAASALGAKAYTKATGNALIGKGSLTTYKNAATQSVANTKTNFGNLTASAKTAASNAKTKFGDFTSSAKSAASSAKSNAKSAYEKFTSSSKSNNQSKTNFSSQNAKATSATPEYTAKEIKTAFREAAKKFHPDMGGSQEMMQKLNTLNDNALKTGNYSELIKFFQANNIAI